MSTGWIERFPLEILLLTIGSIDNRDDLLSFALTCRFIFQLIVPDYLEYFRISSLLENTNLWNHLLQNLHLCRGTHEFELTDGARIPGDQQWTRDLNDSTYATIASNLPQILHNMVNLRRVKFSWTNTSFEDFRRVLDVLGDSGCRLEEFDLYLDIPCPNPSGNSTLLTEAAKLEELHLWSNLNRTTLQKLSIQVGTGLDRAGAVAGRSLTRPANWIGNTLWNAPALTHINLTIQHTSLSVNLLDYTWPNLENLVIIGNSIFTPLQSSSKLVGFFIRHSRLNALSLPRIVYPPSTSPYITVECLPRLESFSHTARLPLSQVLSFASARRLRHLTITDTVASLEHSITMNIYREFTSLQSCCFTLERLVTPDYENIRRILEIFAEHSTDLQKVHLPTAGGLIETFQRFPKLTHLSGLWGYELINHGLVRELYKCHRLEYTIRVGDDHTFCVFRLVREVEPEEKCRLVEVVSERNPDCDMRTWGNFYNGFQTRKPPRRW